MNDHSISVDQARYATSIVTKYFYTETVNAISNFYKTKFPSYMIFTKDDTSASYEQFEKLTRELNINYRACIGSLIHVLSLRVDLSFAVHKLAKFQQTLVKYNLKYWFIYRDTLGKIKLWGLNLVQIQMMHQ